VKCGKVEEGSGDSEARDMTEEHIPGGEQFGGTVEGTGGDR
jgi:hypothetical protein